MLQDIRICAKIDDCAHQPSDHATAEWWTRDDSPFPVARAIDLSEAVREPINKRMRQAPILNMTTSEA